MTNIDILYVYAGICVCVVTTDYARARITDGGKSEG